MTTRPTTLPLFCENPLPGMPGLQALSAGEIDTGFPSVDVSGNGRVLTPGELNFLLNRLGKWVEYMDSGNFRAAVAAVAAASNGRVTPSPRTNNVTGCAVGGGVAMVADGGLLIGRSRDHYASLAAVATSSSSRISSPPSLSTPAGYKVAFGGGYHVTANTEDWFVSADGGVTWVHDYLAGYLTGYGFGIGAVHYSPLLTMYLIVVSSGPGAYPKIYTKPAANILVTGAWSTPSSPSGRFYSGVAESGSLLALASLSGEVVTTTDGTTFTLRSTSNANPLNAIACGGPSRFVAVGDAGTILYSDDGITWSAATAAGSYAGDFSAVVATPVGTFIAYGSNGEIQVSDDGIAWIVAARGGGIPWIAAAHDGEGTLIACSDKQQVGDNPSMLVSSLV